MKMNKVRVRKYIQTMRWGNMHPRCSLIASICSISFAQKFRWHCINVVLYIEEKTNFDGFFRIPLILYENFQKKIKIV
jgi:hypothetical protein